MLFNVFHTSMIEPLSIQPDTITISDEVKARACDCPREHACLSSAGRACCPVTESVGNAIFVDVNHSGHAACPYRVSFGAKHRLCTCPMRHELFRRHKL